MGKPLAGQLGQMGSPTQSQMGGGFGGSQPQLRQPALESPYNGSGGGGMQLPGMGAFQDFMRQQQMVGQQAPQQPAYGGFGNGMGINIAQPPQQSGGLLGSLSPQQPQQNPGGFGNQQQSQLQQALQSFRGQQQPQQAPQMPMIGPGGGGNLDFYQRQMQPPQEFGPSQAAAQAATLQSMGSGFGQNSRPDLTGGPMGAPQQPMQQTNPMQSQMDALRQQQQMSQQAPQPPTLGQATQSQMQQQPQQAAQAQQIYALNQQLQAQGRPGMLGFSPEQMQQSLNQVGGQPQMPLRAPQQVRPEPPRMQAMRGIQQLASRQRGYNR
jgi:hypothetical protein